MDKRTHPAPWSIWVVLGHRGATAQCTHDAGRLSGRAINENEPWCGDHNGFGTEGSSSSSSATHPSAAVLQCPKSDMFL